MSSWVEKLVRKALENRFRAKVLEEAIQQRKLSDAGEPIPSHLRVQARLSGLLIAGASTAGGFALTGLSLVSGWVYVGGLLFCGVLALGGLIQVISGRHLLTRR